MGAELETAIQHWEAALVADPSDAGAWTELGLAYEANDYWAPAVAAFAEALRHDRDNSAIRLHHAIALSQTADAAAARAQLERVVEERPRLPAAWQRLGHLALEQGDLARAVKAFQRVIYLNGTLPHGYAGLGEGLLLQGKFSEAEEALRQALRQRPDYRPARYQLGLVLQRLGQTQEAEAALRLGADAAQELLPDEYTPRLQRYVLNPNRVGEMARLSFVAGDAAGAERLLTTALARFPKDAGLLNNLALVYLETGRLDEARRLLNRELATGEQTENTYLNLAAWASQTQRPDLSIAYADSAVHLAPASSAAHLARAQALMELRRLEPALDAAARAADLDPLNASAHGIAGDLLYQRGAYAEARDRFTHALQIDPSLLPARARLAQSLWALDQKAEALNLLAQLQRKAPQHPLVQQIARQFDREGA